MNKIAAYIKAATASSDAAITTFRAAKAAGENMLTKSRTGYVEGFLKHIPKIVTKDLGMPVHKILGGLRT